MLTSLVMILKVEQPTTFPPYLGRASHAAFLRLIAEADPGLAQRLHAPDERRPFTCSDLWGVRRRRDEMVLTPEQEVFLRYTGLNADVSQHLVRLAQHPPTRIELDGVPFTVCRATLDPAEHPWAGRSTYEELAACHLLNVEPASRVELEFLSPTTFRSGGLNVPLPLPGLVYEGLMEKWNAFAPVSVPVEIRRFAEECLAISRCELSTRPVAGKGEAIQIGFVGRCRYTAVNRDHYWLGIIQLLTDYAFYAGVGYQTTTGMGQARRRMPGGSSEG